MSLPPTKDLPSRGMLPSALLKTFRQATGGTGSLREIRLFLFTSPHHDRRCTEASCSHVRHPDSHRTSVEIRQGINLTTNGNEKPHAKPVAIYLTDDLFNGFYFYI